MDLELISFVICPFAQRAAITLNYKHTPHRITHIDFDHPPDWLRELSPFGKVPLLRVDHTHILFESAVIDEFLDEITPGSLLPQDPLTRALDRSWIEFGSACLVNLSGMMHARDSQRYEDQYSELKIKLSKLENILQSQPYFNGEALSLVDFAYAPLFMRAQLLGLTADLYENTPRIRAWAETLLSLDAVSQSVVSDFAMQLRNHISHHAPYAASRLHCKTDIV